VGSDGQGKKQKKKKGEGKEEAGWRCVVSAARGGVLHACALAAGQLFPLFSVLKICFSFRPPK
jgi:hypothetical protein